MGSQLKFSDRKSGKKSLKDFFLHNPKEGVLNQKISFFNDIAFISFFCVCQIS